MNPLINFTNPLSIITALTLFILVLFLAKETKKSIFIAIMLGIFVAIIIGHSIEFALLTSSQNSIKTIIANCITIDFTFILISYLGYLWIDDIESKYNKKKSIDDSLEWFWKKV